jgi:hypothetical protein
MLQLELFDSQTILSNQAVVNVASVPQRSSFRYAGGKLGLFLGFGNGCILRVVLGRS